jgi:hypothetical protein
MPVNATSTDYSPSDYGNDSSQNVHKPGTGAQGIGGRSVTADVSLVDSQLSITLQGLGATKDVVGTIQSVSLYTQGGARIQKLDGPLTCKNFTMPSDYGQATFALPLDKNKLKSAKGTLVFASIEISLPDPRHDDKPVPVTIDTPLFTVK